MKTLSREELIEAKIAYYLGHPIMTDEEYDDFERIWQQNNPNDRLPVDMGQHLVNFETPYLSLSKLSTEKLVQKLGGSLSASIITPKVDGVSMEVCYDPDPETGFPVLVYAKTRGGVDRTKSFLSAIDKSSHVFDRPIKYRIIVRGECYISNSFLEEAQKLDYANLRNLTAGLINSDKGNEFSGRMDFVVWNWINSPFSNYATSIETLRKIGFRTVEFINLNGYESLKLLEDPAAAEIFRKGFPFEVDGLVFWKNDRSSWVSDEDKTVYQNAFAWKFPALFAETVIEDVVWSTGNSGYVTPVVKVNPVEIGGITVRSINMFNPQNMYELNVKIGSVVKVRRAGDVIPHIMEPCIDTSISTDVVVPTLCPVCEEQLISEGPRIRCVSPDCGSRFSGVLRAWVDAHNMKHFSNEAIEFLTPYFKSSKVHPVAMIHDLDETTVTKYFTPGKAKRFWNNLQEAKKNATAASLIASLKINMVGSSLSKKVMKEAKNIHNVKEYLDKKRNSSGLSVAEGYLLSWLEVNPEHWQDILDVADHIGVTKYEDVEKTGGGRGKIVITGTLPGLTRSEAFRIAEDLGWVPTESLNKDVKYLVSEKSSGSSKFKKATELNIPIITWSQFMSIGD